MSKQIRLVPITLALKETAFEKKTQGPEQEIEDLLTKYVCKNPNSSIQDWQFQNEKPQNTKPITIDGSKPIFNETDTLEFNINKKTQTPDKAITNATKKLNRPPDECSLDDFIHDVTNKLASNINNQTLESQIEFLQKNVISHEELLQALISKE